MAFRIYALLLLFQSASLLANFLCQASAADQGQLDLRIEPQWGGAAVSGPPLRSHQLCDQSCYSFQYIRPPVRRYSNIYVSFEEIQQYICLRGDPTIYIYVSFEEA